MPHNAELYLQPTAQEKTARPRLKYGARLAYPKLLPLVSVEIPPGKGG
jgi:hypothetical protein